MSLVFTQIATDNFTPDANPLNPAKWQTFTGLPSFIATGGVAECGLLSSSANIYIGASFSADQYVSFTVTQLLVSPNDISAVLRSDGSATTVGYLIFFTQNGDGTCEIDMLADGVFSALNPAQPFSLGDEFTCGVIGSTIYILQNGTQIYSGSHTSTSTATHPGLFSDGPTASQSEIQISNFKAGNLSASSTVPSTEFALKIIPGDSSKDYLQVLDSKRNVIGWIDPNGLRGGTLGTAGNTAPRQYAQWVIPDNVSKDYLKLVNSSGVTVAYINPSGVYVTDSLSTNDAKITLKGNASQDFIQLKDSKGAVIGGINYTGALQGTLAT